MADARARGGFAGHHSFLAEEIPTTCARFDCGTRGWNGGGWFTWFTGRDPWQQIRRDSARFAFAAHAAVVVGKYPAAFPASDDHRIACSYRVIIVRSGCRWHDRRPSRLQSRAHGIGYCEYCLPVVWRNLSNWGNCADRDQREERGTFADCR